MVLSFGALLLLVEMPIVGRLISVVQTHYLVAVGWLLLACTMYLSTQQLDLAVSFQSVTWLRVLRYFPIPLIFIPTPPRPPRTSASAPRRTTPWPGSSTSP